MSGGDQGLYSSHVESMIPSSHTSAEVEWVVGAKGLEFRGEVRVVFTGDSGELGGKFGV